MTFLPLVFLAYAVVAFAKPRWAFLLFVGFLPTYLIRFPLGGVPTTALEILFAILAVAWFLKREKRLIDIRGWGALLMLWLGVATLQMFVSPDFRAAAGVWKAYFIEPALFFIMACDFLRTHEERDQALRALGSTAFAIGGLALIQRFTGWGVPPPFNGVPIPPATEAEFRSTAFYGFPNAIGLFLAPLIPLFVGGIFLATNIHDRKDLKIRLAHGLYVAALCFSLLALLLAESEGAVIGAAAGIAVAGILAPKTRKLALGLCALGLLVILAVAPLRHLAVEKATLSDWSGRVRKEIWTETFEMLKDRPLLGAGLSGYQATFAPYHKAGHIEIFQYPHTILLNLWTELGIAGIAVFALIMARFFQQALATKSWTLAGGGVAVLVHGLVDVPYFKNDLAMLFWLLMAFAASHAAETRRVSS
ncbi:MAG: O-antigen ligase family protein [Patescibacteria group bacterium]